jgi:hypothetical protein
MVPAVESFLKAKHCESAHIHVPLGRVLAPVCSSKYRLGCGRKQQGGTSCCQWLLRKISPPHKHIHKQIQLCLPSVRPWTALLLQHKAVTIEKDNKRSSSWPELSASSAPTSKYIDQVADYICYMITSAEGSGYGK